MLSRATWRVIWPDEVNFAALESRASKLARGRSVGLSEGLKETQNLVGAHADAGVAHLETQPIARALEL